MIVFNLRLAARSMRWLGPVLIAMIWMSFAVTDPGPALGTAANSFILVVAVACWITIAIGNVDDDGHRELLAAAAGSPARLHRARSLSSYAAANVIGTAITVTGIVVASTPTPPMSHGKVLGACVVLELAATAIGVGVGSLLHRPVVRHAGATLLVAVGALVGLILLPPVQHVLRQMNDGRIGGLVPFVVVAIAGGAALVAVAAVLADRRN